MQVPVPMRAAVAALALAASSGAALAQAAPPMPEGYAAAPTANVSGYFAHWFDRVNAAQASQPHWITPLVTVTPRLEEEVRYDQYWEHQATGAAITTYGSGKGLELIPTTTNEILLNPPIYDQRTVKKPAAGWGDDPFLVIKQRLLSANEEQGNYILTTFLGVQAPTGNRTFTNDAWVVTPTLAGGKGWGDFDIQATVGVPVPLAHERVIGTAVVTNVTLQYHVATYFWPEIEMNWTNWLDGVRGGKNQVFVTPGIVVGRFPIYGRVRLIVGGGYQLAVSPKLSREPVLTPVYDHAWIFTARVTF